MYIPFNQIAFDFLPDAVDLCVLKFQSGMLEMWAGNTPRPWLAGNFPPSAVAYRITASCGLDGARP